MDAAPASGTSSFPRSSSSADVASRPAKTPKFTRISNPAFSCSVTNAIAFSTCIERRIAAERGVLTLDGLPAEPSECDDGAREPPRYEDGDRARLRPQTLTMEIDRVDDLDEVLHRQDGRDRLQHLRIVLGGAEPA